MVSKRAYYYLRFILNKFFCVSKNYQVINLKRLKRKFIFRFFKIFNVCFAKIVRKMEIENYEQSFTSETY